MAKIVPYDIAWGGRLTNDTEMYVFESISILINGLLFIALLIKGGLLLPLVPMKVVNVFLWIFFALFVVNTIGNVFAKTNFEKFFTIVTLAFAVLIWLVMTKKPEVNKH